ncbi:MAG TPA: methyltransferase domain-containing protein [Thermomicrobiaceae bacterium]|nr:methyltransferase domain-containing protein [Thermomicrobiaceae bacterium]
MSDNGGTVDQAEQIKQRVREQFGAAGDAYVRSAGHREGDDLGRLVTWAELTPQTLALDIATGGGHTALAVAPHVGRVTVTDLTPQMLDQARVHLTGKGITNAEYWLADAEDLPFPDAAFDVVTCRIAPHHFADVDRFVAEVARVLRPGGRLMLVDSVVPEDAQLDAFVNTLEARRDPSHVRSLRLSEWVGLLEGHGLAVEGSEIFTKRHEWEDWTTRSRMTDADREALEAWVLAAPEDCRECAQIEVAGGRLLAWTDEKALIKARKRG